MNKTLLQVLVAVPCLLAEAALPYSFNYGGTRYADLPETGKVVCEKDGRRVSELTWTAPDGKLRIETRKTEYPAFGAVEYALRLPGGTLRGFASLLNYLDDSAEESIEELSSIPRI